MAERKLKQELDKRHGRLSKQLNDSVRLAKKYADLLEMHQERAITLRHRIVQIEQYWERIK